jgi:hypothetical protein
MVRDFIPNNVTGISFNHHNRLEPDWRNACWGADHYEKLEGIKDKYDPDRVFNCWHCVGYQGLEAELGKNVLDGIVTAEVSLVVITGETVQVCPTFAPTPAPTHSAATCRYSFLSFVFVLIVLNA